MCGMLPYRWRGLQWDQTKTTGCYKQPNMQIINGRKREREANKMYSRRQETQYACKHICVKSTVHIQDRLYTCMRVNSTDRYMHTNVYTLSGNSGSSLPSSPSSTYGSSMCCTYCTNLSYHTSPAHKLSLQSLLPQLITWPSRLSVHLSICSIKGGHQLPPYFSCARFLSLLPVVVPALMTICLPFHDYLHDPCRVHVILELSQWKVSNL